MGDHSMLKGKIVLVTFPFDDFSTVKVRPAVCLTEPIGIYEHVILAFISSKIPSDLLETDLILDSTQINFTTTGLRLTSTLRLHRIITVTLSLIQRELGELSPRLQGEVDYKIKKLFKL